jgi:hypothetical protein
MQYQLLLLKTLPCPPASLSCRAVLHGWVAILALQVISVEPPNFVELEVVDAPPGVKGNTASGECWQMLTQC